MTRILAWMLPVCLGIGAAIWLSPAWPQSTYDAPPTGAEIGRIVITNQVQTDLYNRSVHRFGDVEVTVHYMSTPNYGPKDHADRVMVAVPDGYVAIPDEVILPEGETVEIAVYEAIIG